MSGCSRSTSFRSSSPLSRFNMDLGQACFNHSHLDCFLSTSTLNSLLEKQAMAGVCVCGWEHRSSIKAEQDELAMQGRSNTE